MKKDGTNINAHIVRAIERNFGGIDTAEVISSFTEAFIHNKALKDFKSTNSSILISDNIKDLSSRNLMIISEH